MNTEIFEILTGLAQSAGINIRRCDFGSSINGLFWDPIIKPPVIFLDNNLKEDELNMVLAHELGHSQLMQLEDGDLINCKDKTKVIRAEKQADAFAEMLIQGIKIALNLAEREVNYQ